MIALPPIQFDRASGALEGANLWERTAALALVTGSKISSHFSHRGYNGCANLLRKALPERNIAIKLNEDATFEFPYGDGYWSKLLNRSYHYEDELELLFRHSADIDYTLLDCGANYGYWSVLVTSKPFGARKAIAIEPSSENFPKLANNAKVNGNRFEALKCAIGAAKGTARLSGTKHEAFSIVAGANGGGEEVPVLALDGGEIEREREGEAGEQAGDEVQPRPPQPAPIAVDDGKQRQQNDIGDRVVLAGRTGRRVGEHQPDVFGPAAVLTPQRVGGSLRILLHEADIEVPAEHD